MASIIVSICLLIIAVCISPQFKGYTLKRTVILALLLAISVGGRLLFSAIPSFQLSSYTVIIAGAVFGGGAGFLVGIGTALLSNLILGFGPFVAWQALGWGLMGLFAAFLSQRGRYVTAIYGLSWGYLYGFITNLWYMLDGFVPISVSSVIAAQASSFYFDTVHALTNLILLLILPHFTVKKLMQRNVGEV